ncbi:MAG: FGGY family carbohydrate kinase [Lachnospiraceae bacterium]|nr:FGGY family carbohydrate kinase [Lachnospiraceae bacterium]
MNYYIGIDIGTSSAKLLLLDDQGSVHAQERVCYDLLQTQTGWFEIEPNEWFKATIVGIKKLLIKFDPKKVKGIGFTGQMHTTVFLDKHGNSIRPALSWNDTRTSEYLELIKEKISNYKDLQHISGIISTGSPAVNLLWLKEQEAGNFKKLHKILIGPDYLTYRFSGKYGADYCEASTSSLYDIHNRTWSEKMCNIIGIPLSILPPVYHSGYKVGVILPELSEVLGFNKDVQIIIGTGDNPATYFSSSMLKNKEPIISLGTSGILMYNRCTVNEKSKGKSTLFSINDKDFYIIVQGAVQSSGSCYNWWVKKFIEVQDFDEIKNNVNITKPINHQLLFYPHLNGEKTIYADPHLKGALIGIGTDVDKEEVTRAIFEGISFAFKQLIEQMQIDENFKVVKVTGRMSTVRPFIQILADILQVKIETDDNISAVQGMAIITAQSCENKLLNKETGRNTQIFYPRSSYSRIYVDKYQKYKKIYHSIKEVYC